MIDKQRALIPWPQSLKSRSLPTGPLKTQTGSAAGSSVSPAQVACEPLDEEILAYAQSLLAHLPLGDVRMRLPSDISGQERVPQLGVDESYSLSIPAESGPIEIHAKTRWGALHGLRTLWGFGDAERVPCTIADHPRFPWRGLLLDVARHFIPAADLRRMVDGLALLKLNVLHLHLTDDQAFRFPSRTLPDAISEQHYTRAELIDLVAYAAVRGVRLVPEIDIPGHVTCLVAAYPELGVVRAQPTERFGVHQACLDPTNEAVYAALENLFSEVAEIFADDCVHLGGDEVHPKEWSESDHIQAFIRDHALTDGRGLQNYFNQRVCKILASLGKRPIGWDEVLHESMPAMIVQNWRGMSTRDRALDKSLDCIVSAPYYLDLFYPAYMHYQHDPQASQREALDLEDTQQNDPVNAHVRDGIEWTRQWRRDSIDTVAGTGQVLGGEACLWSELVDANVIDVRLWSRLPAIAERLWSAAEVRDPDDLYVRMQNLLEREPYSLGARQQSALRELGLRKEQAEVACLMEPVKWYARLLGEQALQARLAGAEMPQARPYDVGTPLNRIVDHISPESLSARALGSYERDQMRAEAEVWRKLVVQEWPQDTQPAIRALRDVGELVESCLSNALAVNDLRESLATLYGPHGEYMLAVVPAVQEWLDREWGVES